MHYGDISIESRSVNYTATLANHLYLTFWPLDTLPSSILVISGKPTNDSTFGPWGPLQAQIDVLLPVSQDAYPADDPYGDGRGRTFIDDSSPEFPLWEAMVSTATSIVSQNYEYNAFARVVGSFNEANAWQWVALNSNSFVTSILYHNGIDPADYMPTNLGIIAVTPGRETLLDTAGGHTLSAAGYFADIFAGDGNDAVTGDSDRNYLFGGSGNDRINGGSGDDILSGGLGGDKLKGEAGNDTLFGNEAGSDVLNGGTGLDQLYGSAGYDRFDFDAIGDSGTTVAAADRIRNFEQGIDRIDLATIDANSGLAGNQAFAFIGDAWFTAIGQVKTWIGTATTYAYLNTVDGTAAEMIVRIDGIFTLTAADFIL